MTRRRTRWRRPGALYEFWGYDPRALLRGVIRIICLYVGQTRQKPETRRRQHLYGSPNGEPAKVWAPLITDWRVSYRRTRVTSNWLDIREAGRVLKLAPAANIKLNMANPKRIPPWEMKALMSQIAAAGGVAALVAAADWRGRATAGWRYSEDGSTVTWYGNQAERIGGSWLQQSTGYLSSSELVSASLSASPSRSSAYGSTGREPD